MTLRASFKELTTEPVNLVNKIYQFMGINMGAEYIKRVDARSANGEKLQK